MKKFFSILSGFAMLFSACAAIASDTVRDFELGHVKIPVYQKGKLDFIIFADSGNRRSMMLSGKNTLIDRLLDNANVDKIPDGWQEKIYPLNAKLPEVLKFWKKRYTSSEAVIFTPRCNFDRKNNIVYSSDDVKMRTPTFDLDGIGFRSDLGKKELEINSDVQIIARRDDSDPREVIPGKLPVPKVYTTVSATADSLRMDMNNNEIMLIGNVKIVDGTTTLTCDRLTIFLKSKEQQKKSPAKNVSTTDTGDSSAMLKGISRMLADGEVVLIRKPEGSAANSLQTAKCEHLDYDFDSGLIILTDEDSMPQLTQDNYTLTGKRIELLRFSRKAFVKDNCRITEYQQINGKKQAARTIDSDCGDFDGDANLNIFTGNVKVKESDAEIYCDRMEVFLKAAQTANKKTEKKSENQEFSPVSGSQELDRIHCKGNVKIISIPKPAVNNGNKKKTVATQPSVIVSKRCDLDYAADKLVFHENVKVNHQGDTLDCDRLDLFLKDSQFRKSSGQKSSSGVALGGRGSGNKTLTRAIASGNVYMKDQESDLATELMTLDFKELPPGTRQTPGMFATNDIQLIRVTCDGKVVANSLPGLQQKKQQQRLLKAEHAMSDLLKNRSEFHKNVYLKEDANELFCKDMFVYTGAAPQIPDADKKADTPVDDPDADPFELKQTENAAPSRIALSDGIDLERIVCKNNVILINKDKDGKITHAGGDTAIYTVKTGDIVITADSPRRAMLRRAGRIQYSNIIRGNLRTEELNGEGNVQVVPDENFKREKENNNK